MSLGNLILRSCDIGFAVLEALRRVLRRPPVRTVTTTDLKAAIDSAELSPVLIDVRSKAERSVSRIPDAITPQAYFANRGNLSGRPIVAHCTVGGRSYLFARKLVAAGIDARNYRDSLLGWCRAGLPLETPEGKPTNALHPYWRIFDIPDGYLTRTR